MGTTTVRALAKKQWEHSSHMRGQGGRREKKKKESNGHTSGASWPASRRRPQRMRTTAPAAGTALVHINAVNETSTDAQASYRYEPLVRRPATGASATRCAVRAGLLPRHLVEALGRRLGNAPARADAVSVGAHLPSPDRTPPIFVSSLRSYLIKKLQ